MGFDSPAFLAFFVVYFVLFHFAARTPGRRNWLVVAGSLVFYGAWSLRSVPILLLTGTFNYSMGLRLARQEDARRRKALLAAGVALDLAALAFFKYSSVFLGRAPLADARSWASPVVLLPLGMSFYILQCVSYLVDIHRGAIEPSREPRDFLAALTFFPRLLAGPFVRWADWLPQFQTGTALEWPDVERAFVLISLGLAKTAAAALAAPLADALFQGPAHRSALESWTGVLAFAGQIYGEFSGYSDIAIGCSLLLGFSVPANFDLPFAASTPIKFWRRWHATFSRWLYEYVYLPLALEFRRRTALALLATVLLAGLWHGAKGTFLVYGAYNGILLAAAYWVVRRLPEDWVAERAPLPCALMTAATFYLILLGFVLFRSETVSQALDIWASLHGAGAPSRLSFDAAARLTGAVAAAAFGHVLDSARETAAWKRPYVLWPAAVAAFAFSFLLLGHAADTFVYFTF